MSQSCSTTARFDVLIVGGGMGGAQTAIALRRHGFTGTIGVVGAEPDAPYERPALSKGYLLGIDTEQKIMTRPREFWSAQHVKLILNEVVASINPDDHLAVTSSGKTYGYRHLVWAAGGSPRRLSLPGAESSGVHYIRSRADVDGLRAALTAAKRVAIVGGGYIGLETAAALRTRGFDVTVLEVANRVLARVSGRDIADFLEAVHAQKGVDVRTGVIPERIVEHRGSIAAVGMADGTEVGADLVVVGIGIQPTIGPLSDAGATCANGVEIDDQCRTSLADVFAIGDCALHRQLYAAGEYLRLESVQNAHDQADTAARNIVGRRAHYDAVPWFWSNQYDIRLQTAGIARDHDSVEIVGSIPEAKFSVRYLKGGVMVAADCVNSPREYMAARKTLATQLHHAKGS